MSKIELTTKVKNGLIIGAVNTIVIVVISALYIFLFYNSTRTDLHGKLLKEAEEIVTSYMYQMDGKFLIDPSSDRSGIEQDLHTDSLSALIFNEDLQEIGRFGIFDYIDDVDSENEEITKVASESFNLSKYHFYSEFSVGEQGSYELLSYPLIINGKPVGVLLIFAPTKSLNDLLSLSIQVAVIVVIISALINLWLGQVLANFTNKPIRKLIKEMSHTNIKTVSKKVAPQGNPKDDQYQLAVKYNEMLERINEGVQKQKEFISNASHEFKSPIARVISSLDVIKMKFGKLNIKENEIGVAIDSSRQDLIDLGNQVHNLLVLAKVSEQKIKYENVDLQKVIDEICQKYNSATVTNKILDVYVNFNSDLVKLILSNLIENAIKYGKNKSIVIGGNVEHSNYELYVSNSTKPNESTSSKSVSRWADSEKGYGLGLSIITDIVEQEGLEMVIENTDGLFRVSIGGFELSE